MSISDFQSGKKVDDYFVIKSVSVKISTANNNRYLDFIFVDNTGEVNGKLWKCTEEDVEELKENLMVKVKGSVIDWQGSLQLRIDKIRKTNASDNVDIGDFVPSAPFKKEEMYEVLIAYIEKVKNKEIKELLSYMIDEKKEKLLVHPAAMKNHHSIRSGLLYHTTTMLKAGEKICEIYDFLDRDLVYAGVILHDLLKIDEMDASSLGIVSDYTLEGQLLGHIIQGVKAIEVVGEMMGADKEIITVLQHIVLSHHYEPEYGSPKKPMIPEGEVLHFLDDLDAKLFDMKKALATTEKGTFSESIWSLDKRRVYRKNF